MGEIPKPVSPQETAEAVAAGLANDTPLEIIGAGTRRALGRPVAAAAALDVTGLSGVSMYEPEELVFTARAGTPLADIEAMLAEKGQMLAFEPPDFSHLLGTHDAGRGTLAGMTACGLSGPRRVKIGAVRDHLLGFAGVTGRAEIFKSGGRVMKNVTGYDLSKLMAGGWGTLAVLTELTFKVLPAPETTATVVLSGLDEARGNQAMTLGMQAPAEVSGAAHVPAGLAKFSHLAPAGGGAATLLRVEGFAPSVKARVEMLKGLLADFGDIEVLENDASLALWRQVRDVHCFAGGADTLIWRISCPPAQGARVAAAIREGIPDVRLLMDWAGGLIWLEVPVSEHACAETVRGALASCGGHATLFRAPEDLRRALPVFQPQPKALAEVTARIKAAFDPKDILNPGRVYPSERREG